MPQWVNLLLFAAKHFHFLPGCTYISSPVTCPQVVWPSRAGGAGMSCRGWPWLRSKWSWKRIQHWCGNYPNPVYNPWWAGVGGTHTSSIDSSCRDFVNISAWCCESNSYSTIVMVGIFWMDWGLVPLKSSWAHLKFYPRTQCVPMLTECPGGGNWFSNPHHSSIPSACFWGNDIEILAACYWSGSSYRLAAYIAWCGLHWAHAP